MNDADRADLVRARTLLEAPSLTLKLSRLVGAPIEHTVARLPPRLRSGIQATVRAALLQAARAALFSLDNQPGKTASLTSHQWLSALCGAVGGAMGFATFAIELPISTTLMLRAVADVARSEGFDLAEPGVKEACLEVLAFGSGDAREASYYAVRSFMAEAVQQTSKELLTLAAKSGSSSVGATQAAQALAKLIEKIAARFGVVVSEKMAAQATPLLGAAAGASINALFTSTYQDLARGHFIVKRLERRYGEAAVARAYRDLSASP